MAGIKETKEQLRKEIHDLYKRFIDENPGAVIPGKENKNDLLQHAELASALSKKLEALGYLAAIEEEKPTPVIVPSLPEIKTPGITFSEMISSAEKDVPPPVPFAEMKNPEVIFPKEKNNSPAPFPEMKTPEVIPQYEKNNSPTPFPEMKTPEVIPQPEKNISLVPFPEMKTPEVISPAEKIIPPPSIPEIKKPEISAKPSPAIKTFPDIKTFVGFNEKLMFIRNLFKGNGTDYENAVAELNNCTSYKEAETVLQNFSAANNWSHDTEPVQIFYSIIKRRFA